MKVWMIRDGINVDLITMQAMWIEIKVMRIPRWNDDIIMNHRDYVLVT